jgi:hypothetical protein
MPVCFGEFLKIITLPSGADIWIISCGTVKIKSGSNTTVVSYNSSAVNKILQQVVVPVANDRDLQALGIQANNSTSRPHYV